MRDKTYQEWIQEVQWLQTKIILPDGKRIDKTTLFTNKEIDANKLNNILKEEYGKSQR